jgi:hypothetical protein
MVDWYVSSVAYAAVPTWAALHAYSVGNFVRPTAPSAANSYVQRCTTAGTSGGTEPTWNTADNGTTTDGGVTWTNVGGQSTYGWSAASGNLYSHTNAGAASKIGVAGSRIFVSSDHAETNIASTYQWSASSSFGVLQIISVNRAGSVPPVAADELSGASISANGGFTWDNLVDTYTQGLSFNLSVSFQFNNTGVKAAYFKNCAIIYTSAANLGITTLNPAKVTFDNSTIQFGATTQKLIGLGTFYPGDFTWLLGSISGTLPSTLIVTSTPDTLVALRGADLSNFTGTLLGVGAGYSKCLLDSCKIAAAMTRYATPSSTSNPADELELINCFDGTNTINERYTPAGQVSTDRATYLTGGAQDDLGNYSLKMASSSRADFVTLPLDCFAFDVENTAVGTSKTATVEIISSGTLNNNDIRLQLEYMGASGSPIASFGNSLASVLTATSALPSSSNTWSSPPSTPQKQLLQVTFTPQRAGRVRGVARLGKPSTTVWINPQIAIT